MREYNRVKALAREIVGLLLDDGRFRKLMREVALNVVVALEEQKKVGMVRSFLDSCLARKANVRVDDDGKLVCNDWKLLGDDLRAVLIVYRQAIIDHLIAVRDLEKRTTITLSSPKKRA